jgi:hypothetical protein
MTDYDYASPQLQIVDAQVHIWSSGPPTGPWHPRSRPSQRSRRTRLAGNSGSSRSR